MAGAVSAGAYTAGVLDFLLRALDAHNDRCNPDAPPEDEDTPRHKVVLKAVSGASAGGVCTGLSIVGLVGDQKPGEARLNPPKRVESAPGAPYAYDYSYTFSALHEVWVTSLDLWRPESQQGFLALDDLRDKNVQLQSVLNGGHIDDAADKALGAARWGSEDAPGSPYSFLAEQVDMFLTTTNLMGAPYEVHFTGGDGDEEKQSGHKMAQHSAVRHFRVEGLGTHPAPSIWLDRWEDAGIPLPLPATPGDPLPFDQEGSAWRDFKISAIATGAFPGGLAPRLISAEAQDFGVIAPGVRARGGALPVEADPKYDDPAGADPTKWRHPRPVFGVDVAPEGKVHFIAVDGGVANNEPFEYARFAIRGPGKKPKSAAQAGDGYLAPNPRDADKADRAVIMIDPFPEGPEHVPLTFEEAEKERGLLPSLKRLFPSLINQARFKPAELMYATDQAVHSRFLIAPSRRSDVDRQIAGAQPHPDEHTPAAGAAAIASGAFSGFSGFFDHSFRVHDFVLGQRNCQSFLKNYFTLDAANPVLNLPKPLRDKGGRRRVIDPGAAMLNDTIRLPAWPRIGNDRLDPLLKQADLRLGAVGERIVSQISENWAFQAVVGLAWGSKLLFPGVKTRANNLLIKIVLGEFIRRDQHVDYKDLNPEMREIVISLLNAGNKPATAEELIADMRERARAEASDLHPREVEDALDGLGARIVWRARGFGGPKRYTHALFKPGLRKQAKLLFGGLRAG